MISFVKGGPIEEVRGSAFLCVALTGIARGTRSTVLPLAERRKSDPRVDPLLARLGELSRAGRSAFERGALAELGARFDDAHAGLCELGVSCRELNDLVGLLRHAGALGAKLTGAGGGGAAIGLARDEGHARDLAAKSGGFAVRIGA